MSEELESKTHSSGGSSIARSGGMLMPIDTIESIMAAQEAMTEVVKKVLKLDRDYGKVPGTDRETLFKAGAERVCMAFGVREAFETVESEVDHDRTNAYTKRWKSGNNWVEEAHESTGLYRHVAKCLLYRRDTGELLGEAIGAASSMESKYISRPRDCENTVIKMAQKRAFVAAVLIVFGLSDRFTQDTEDLAANRRAAGELTKEEQMEIANEHFMLILGLSTREDLKTDSRAEAFRKACMAKRLSWSAILCEAKIEDIEDLDALNELLNGWGAGAK